MFHLPFIWNVQLRTGSYGYIMIQMAQFYSSHFCLSAPVAENLLLSNVYYGTMLPNRNPPCFDFDPVNWNTIVFRAQFEWTPVK